MRRLFAEFERDPEWLDREQVELGAQVFRRYGTSVFSFATTSTLEMYSESSIAKPLSLSGGYAGRGGAQAPAGDGPLLDRHHRAGRARTPGARGRATAMRVRVMHVFIRRRLIEHPEWDLRGVGGADLDLGCHADPDGRQRRAGAGAVERRASDDDPGDRGAAALLALRRAPARRPAGLVSGGLQESRAADVRGVRQARLHRRTGREGAGRVIPAGVRAQARHVGCASDCATSSTTAPRSATPGSGCSRPAIAGTRCRTRGPGRCIRWPSSPSCSRWRACAGCCHRSTVPPTGSSAGGATTGTRTRPGGATPSSARWRSSGAERRRGAAAGQLRVLELGRLLGEAGGDGGELVRRADQPELERSLERERLRRGTGPRLVEQALGPADGIGRTAGDLGRPARARRRAGHRRRGSPSPARPPPHR